MMPGRHSLSGFSVTTVSTMLSGAGSVGVSACPILPKTRLDLRELLEHAVLRLDRGARLGDRDAGQRRRHVEDRALVERRHELGAEAQVDPARSRRRRARAATIVSQRNAQHELDHRLVEPHERRLIGCFSSLWIVPTSTALTSAPASAAGSVNGSMRVNSRRIAGSSVIASTAAIAMEKFLVKASGLKSRPSCASSAKIGMNETAITSSEKKLGPPTSFTASMTTSRSRRAGPPPPSARASCASARPRRSRRPPSRRWRPRCRRAT